MIAFFLAFLLFSYYNAKYCLGLFIILMPLLGQQPGYPNNKYFFASLLGIIIGIFLKGKRSNLNPLFFKIILFFLIICFLSLLPYFYKIFNFLYFYYDFQDWLISILDAPAENALVSLRNISLYIMWVLFTLLLIRSAVIKEMANSLAIFLCMSSSFYSFIGLLDYFHIIDLNKLRPITFPTEHRLQSIFWHPAWLAEYISMILPFFLTILKPRMSKKMMLINFTLLFLNILAVVLTFQRGGIVALLALFIIWVFLEFKKRRKLFIILSFSFIFLIILSLITAYWIDPEQFYFKFVKKLLENNRTKYWSAAMDMFFRSPLLGIGLDTYGWRYTEFRPKNSPDYLYLHGTAHNQYFQFIAGTGAIGIVAYLILYFYILFYSYKKYKETLSNFDFSKFLAFSIFGIYSLYQEMFYCLCIGTLFWIVAASIEFKGSIKKGSLINYLLYIIIIFLIANQSYYIFKEKEIFEKLVISEGYGFYDKEVWDLNKEVRWMGKRAILPVKNIKESLFLLAMHPDIQKKPVEAKIFIGNKLIKIIRWDKAEWKLIELAELMKFNEAKNLMIEVNRTWIPKNYGRLDNRSLGVAISFF